MDARRRHNTLIRANAIPDVLDAIDKHLDDGYTWKEIYSDRMFITSFAAYRRDPRSPEALRQWYWRWRRIFPRERCSDAVD